MRETTVKTRPGEFQTMQEIERKYLVNSNSYRSEARCRYQIVQGYLNTHPERSVRVRVKDQKGYITVKGKSNEAGTLRLEWEYPIPAEEAEALLALCEPGQIDKIRYEIAYEGLIFEVDEFFGENEGLVLAEVELTQEDQPVAKPTWLGKEVTGEVRYYNAYLLKHPFNTWNQ
ncbi:CYTH domain-containing protein [Altibacter sp. HG106]|uniref:CYTH domain-containing protein n=1 Tax=Altibacter sp. HG106 TaxID=3023937 RepID=UPI0030102F86